jgi:hypothetical protein
MLPTFCLESFGTRHMVCVSPLGDVPEPHPPSSTKVERRCGYGVEVAESEPLMALIRVMSAPDGDRARAEQVAGVRCVAD